MFYEAHVNDLANSLVNILTQKSKDVWGEFYRSELDKIIETSNWLNDEGAIAILRFSKGTSTAIAYEKITPQSVGYEPTTPFPLTEFAKYALKYDVAMSVWKKAVDQIEEWGQGSEGQKTRNLYIFKLFLQRSP
jgi:hypothetical protein